MSLTVSIFRKQGLPGYGSIGASCGVEIELDESLLEQDLEAFHERVQDAFVACNQSVTDELARHQNQNSQNPPVASSCNTRSNSNGHSVPVISGDGNGNGSIRHASDKQLNYARQLAGQIHGLGSRRLDDICQSMFGKPLASLSTLDGSGLIDTLKEIKAGNIDLGAALIGAAS